MPTTHQAFKTSLACLLAVSVCGCTQLSNWSRDFGLMDVPVGEIRGHVDQVDQDFAVVHLEPINPSRGSRAASESVLVRIEKGRQDPRLAIVRPDQPIHIENRDAIHHELFSADATNRLHVRLSGGGEADDVRFEAPGLVRGYCRMHPDESYAFLVVDAEYVSSVDERSDFELTRIPVGAYRISATSVDGEIETIRVDVAAGETTRITLHPRSRAGR